MTVRRELAYMKQGLPTFHSTYLSQADDWSTSKLVSTLYYCESVRSIFDSHRYVGYYGRRVIDFVSRVYPCSHSNVEMKPLILMSSTINRPTGSHCLTNRTYIAWQPNHAFNIVHLGYPIQ